MTEKRKKIMRAGALLVASFVLVQTVLSEIPESAFAQQSFNGIESLIQSHNSDEDPFTIVELVPDLSYAKLGFLVGGSEPLYYDTSKKAYQSYTEHLASLTSPDDRKSFSDQTATAEGINLEAIWGEGTILSHAAYSESYVKQKDYIELKLAADETIAKDTSGYYMKLVGTNQGAYILSTSYRLQAGGGYDQNVSYYGTDKDNKYYEVTFKAIDDIGTFTGVAYTVMPTSASKDVPSSDSTGYYSNIYYYTDTNTTLVKLTSANYDTVKTDSSVNYCTVYFQKATGELDASQTYYQVETVRFVSDGTATYGAVLDETTPYVTNAAGGNFSSEGTAYQYVGEGMGTYRLDVDAAKTLDYPVTVSTIYYTGGYTNNELFKQYVFNQSGLLNGTDIAIKVVPMTPEQFFTYAGDMDLLYISDSSRYRNDTLSTVQYSTSNDLTALQAMDIYTKVISSDTYLPVILDYGILEESGITNTNIYKLAKLLTAQELTEGNATLTGTNADSTNPTVSFSVADGITAFSDKDHHYVNGNVYVIPKDTDTSSFLNGFATVFVDGTNATNDKFEADAQEEGFGDVADTIVAENLYRQVENNAATGNTYQYFDQKISKAIAVEYIISYATKREEYENYELQVLDIEPCTVNASTQTEIESNIKSYLGITDGSQYTVNVVHMTSAEFISKVEDLCKYDMIYMGLYTDTLNTDSTTGRTVYNDTDMNGLVYTNVGDIQTDRYAYGLLDTEYVTPSSHYSITNPTGSQKTRYNNAYDKSNLDYVRYSGNDFTEEKVKAIENFVKSGSPVILADNFLTTAGGKTYVYDFARNSDGTKDTTKQGYIDNCSRVYALIDAIKDNANVIKEGSVKSSAATRKILYQYITLGKPLLTVTTAAKETGQEYVKTDGAVVSMDFSIANFGSADANATFNCVIYADYNADGRYSNTTERIGANDFTITLNGVKQTVKSKTDDEGNTYYYYELSPNSGGTKYHLEYALSDDYVGVIPMKIKVSQSSNDYRYASEELYFFKENSLGEKLKVHVLQILPSAGANIFNMGEKGVYDGTLETYTAFYHYLHTLEDYDITIDAMNASRYADMYAEDPSFLDDYDMLVLGFADCYNFLQINNSYNEEATINAYQGIQDFIDSGKSVLFTHDTTSYGVMAESGYGNWGLVMNSLLPQAVGFDRYGINESMLLRAGIKNLSKGGTTTYNVSDYQSLTEAYESGILTKTSYTASELFDLIVAEAEANNKDISYKPNSDKTVLASEVQGQSSMTINRNLGGEFSYKNVNTNPGGLPTTTQVELINEGQILVYPYNILDTMKANNNVMTVATTHGQYYQIDMNEDADLDGESDITVWLSLTGDPAYDAAKKDARNNYYIYTKGNVTYSGVGHSNMDYYYTGAETGTNAMELKLYINTMVAAYNAGAHAPTVSLTQEDDTELSTIYVGMDSKISESGVVDDGEQIDQGAEKVYFSVKDTNVTQGGTKKISVDYYLVYGDTIPAGMTAADVVNIGSEEAPVYAKKCDWDTYRSNGKVQDSTDITSGVSYYVNIPYDIVDEVENGRALIYVMATTSLWRENADPNTTKPSGTYSSYNDLYVQRLGLFDLD